MSDKPLDFDNLPPGSTMHVTGKPRGGIDYELRAQGDPISSGTAKSQGLSWEDSLKLVEEFGIRNATARAVRPDPRSGFDPSLLPVYPEGFVQKLLELKPLPSELSMVTGRVVHTPEGFQGWPGVNASPNLDKDSPA